MHHHPEAARGASDGAEGHGARAGVAAQRPVTALCGQQPHRLYILQPHRKHRRTPIRLPPAPSQRPGRGTCIGCGLRRRHRRSTHRLRRQTASYPLLSDRAARRQPDADVHVPPHCRAQRPLAHGGDSRRQGRDSRMLSGLERQCRWLSRFRSQAYEGNRGEEGDGRGDIAERPRARIRHP